MTAPTAFGEPLLEPDELAAQLGRNRKWVYRQVAEHGMPAYRLGEGRNARLLFELAAVRAWFDAHKVGEWAEPG